MSLSSFIIKQIPKISQATGLRDPECGCSLSPFNFLEAGCSGNHGNWVDSSRPVWCALTVIGVKHPASSEVNNDSAGQD